jgi:hypothetical protein
MNIILDTEGELYCLWCNCSIGPDQAKVIYGAGTYTLVYHPECDHAVRIYSNALEQRD